MFRSSLLVLLVVACGPKGEPQLPGYCYDDKLFTAALLRCVDASDSREQSRICRRAVHEKCGIVETLSSRSGE